MWRLIDQFIFVPLSFLAVIFGLAWLWAHPPVFFITIGLFAVVISILCLKDRKAIFARWRKLQSNEGK